MMKVCIQNVWPGRCSRYIFTGRDDQGNLHRYIHENGKELIPKEGDVWEISGRKIRDAKYGVQIIVETSKWLQPSGAILVNHLSTHPRYRGINLGTTRAHALWDHWGEELLNLLDEGNCEGLSKTPKISPEIARDLVGRWQESKEESVVIKWLIKHRFPQSLASKILTYYGGDAVSKLEDNPYKLLALSSWSKVDDVAKSLGIRDDDPRRQTAIVLKCLYSGLQEGHTQLSKTAMIRSISKHFGDTDDRLAEVALEFALKSGSIVMDANNVSALGIRMLELDALTRIKSLISSRKMHQNDMFTDTRPEFIRDAILAFERAEGYKLNAGQTESIHLAMTQRISVISGGAGVGKTSILKVLTESHKEAHQGSIYCMALSGQAAKRLRDATGHPSTTIAKFILSVAPSLDDQSCPLIVVDEASMIDLQTIVKLMRSLPNDYRICFVGDKEQLPPIGFGLIFHRLVDSPNVPKVILTEILRQKASTGIPAVSNDIRAGIDTEFPAYVGLGVGVSFVETPKEDILSKLIELKHEMPGAQILAPKNSGGVGVDDINNVFHQLTNPLSKSYLGSNFGEGEPVIYKANDPEVNLVNGSLGIVEAVEYPTLRVRFEDDRIELSASRIQNLKLAYGLTVHSAQGSQFERVIIVIEGCRILDRTWVYTALTRGINQVVFLGCPKALRQAIQSPPKASERNVYFNLL